MVLPVSLKKLKVQTVIHKVVFVALLSANDVQKYRSHNVSTTPRVRYIEVSFLVHQIYIRVIKRLIM